MRIISRYVTIEFLKIFLLISAGLTTVYMVVDLFENLSDFTKNHADFITIIKYFLLRLPQSIYYIVPLSLLFASFLNLGLFIKYNEVTAMRSGGLSSLHITSSILTGTLIISILIFFLNDVIVPVANKRADDIKRKTEKRKEETFFKEDSLWFKSGNYTLYNVRFIDSDKKILWKVTVHSLYPDFRIRESISADKAMLENGQWYLQSGIRRTFHSTNINVMTVDTFEKLPIQFPFDLKDVRHAVVQASETRFSVLRDYIKKIQKEGYEIRRLAVDLYAKTSFPFAGFIMTVIGISLALNMKRLGGMAPGIGLCILVSLLYWVCFSLSLHMGYAGYIPPILSAWMANIILMGIGSYAFYSSTQM